MERRQTPNWLKIPKRRHNNCTNLTRISRVRFWALLVARAVIQIVSPNNCLKERRST
jgi:hypothetical protein